MPVTFPVKGRICHHAPGDVRCAVPLVFAVIFPGMSDSISKKGVIPLNVACNSFGIRIDRGVLKG